MLNFYKAPKPRKNESYIERLWEKWDRGEITYEEYEHLKAKHEVELEKKRKYKQGEPIRTFDELFDALNKDGLVWMFGRPMTYGFVVSQQFATIINELVGGNILRVVKKQEIIQ